MAQTDAMAIAEKLVNCMSSGNGEDYARLWNDDAVLWHNFDGLEMTKAQIVEGFNSFVSQFPVRRITQVQVREFPGGYLQEHQFEAETADGRGFSTPSCLIVTVENGRLRRVHEYVDPSPVFAALEGAGA